MIDKTAYFFWQGEQISWLRYMTLRSFVHHNPDWQPVLYLASNPDFTITWKGIEHQEDYHQNEYENYFSKIYDLDLEIVPYENHGHHPAQNSDLACWDIMSNNSGIFFDMDILFIKSANEFHEWLEDSDTGIDLHSPECHWAACPQFRIGIVCSSGNNQFFKDLLEMGIDNSKNMSRYQQLGSEHLASHLCNLTRPYQTDLYDKCRKPRDFQNRNQDAISRVEKIYGGRTINLSYFDTVYPWDWYEDNPRFYDAHQILGTYFGIHWYGGRPVSQEFNLRLTEDNFRDHKNTICHYAGITY